MLNDGFISAFHSGEESGMTDPRELLPFGSRQLHLKDIARITTALRDVNQAIDTSEPKQEYILIQRALLQKALQLTSIGEVEEALVILEELRRFTIGAAATLSEAGTSANIETNTSSITSASNDASLSMPSILGMPATGIPLRSEGDLPMQEVTFARNVPTVQNWEEIEGRFKEIFPHFFPKLLQHCPTLTHTELKICAMLKSTLRTKDIARLLNQSERNIENHRYRIRKKVNLPNHQSLSVFLELL